MVQSEMLITLPHEGIDSLVKKAGVYRAHLCSIIPARSLL